MAVPKKLKELARKNIGVKEIKKGNEIIYVTFLKRPKKGFFEGATAREREFLESALELYYHGDIAFQKHMKREFKIEVKPDKNIIMHTGYAQVRLMKLEELSEKYIEVRNQAIRDGIKPNDKIAKLDKIYPYFMATKLYKGKVFHQFTGGIGMTLLDHILAHLTKIGVKWVFVTITSEMLVPVLEHSKWTPIIDEYAYSKHLQ